MASKKKYYDIESEYGQPDAVTETGRSFLEWLNLACSGKLADARRKEEQLRIIENFVRENPKIKPVDKDAMTDQAVAEEEFMDHDDIVSETLARIYEEQGFFSRAREVYRKLSLIYPEKSNYFASLIEQTKEKENELKK